MKITPQLLKQLACTPGAKSEPIIIEQIGDIPTQAELQRLGMVRFIPDTSTWVRTNAGDIAIQKLCLTLFDWINGDDNG